MICPRRPLITARFRWNWETAFATWSVSDWKRSLKVQSYLEKMHGEIRASMVARFPYVILFEIQGDTVVMLGIHHAASDQGGWFERSTT